MSKKDIAGKDARESAEKANTQEIEVLEPVGRMSPFISFHYSYREVSSVNGRTRIRSKQKRFTNGKLESEEFEGTLHGDVYDRMAYDMQKFFFHQLDVILKPISMFLPFGPRFRK